MTDISATEDLIIYAPMIAAVIQVVWPAVGLPSRSKGLGALVLGVALAVAMVLTTTAAVLPLLLQGVGAGLAATGVYEAVDKAAASIEGGN